MFDAVDDTHERYRRPGLVVAWVLGLAGGGRADFFAFTGVTGSPTG